LIDAMTATEELLALTKRLLDAIVAGDWKMYEELCDPRLTCFEPEARGHIVEGLAFHKFYFDLGGAAKATNTTMIEPIVKFCGDDAAIVAYIRLTQKLDADGKPITTAMEETRVWQRSGGNWRHVHFHRSSPG
jgi:ketosteroid isomerase-like protein